MCTKLFFVHNFSFALVWPNPVTLGLRLFAVYCASVIGHLSDRSNIGLDDLFIYFRVGILFGWFVYSVRYLCVHIVHILFSAHLVSFVSLASQIVVTAGWSIKTRDMLKCLWNTFGVSCNGYCSRGVSLPSAIDLDKYRMRLCEGWQIYYL